MTEGRAIIKNIELDPEYEHITNPLYSPTLCYAYTEASGGNGEHSMTLVGFTGQRQKSISTADGGIRSVTRLNDLQPEERSIKMQARGVGTRMYNSVEALLGTGEGDEINAYTFQIDPTKIVDRRRNSDGTAWGRLVQATRQAARILESQAISLEETVNGIHRSFGDPEDVDAVLYGQSATMERQQLKIGGVVQPGGIRPEFMVIRNPHIVMRKIGTYRPE